MNIKKHFLVYKGLPKDIYFLFFSCVINRMGSFIMPLMTLILTVKIGFSKPEAGLFSTIAMLSQAPFLLLGGKLIDKLGSKKVIVIFDFLGAFVYLFCGFLKPSITVAILIIIASNLYAIASPAFNSIVAEVTPSSLLKNAYSLLYLGFNLGLTIGPALGGILFNSHLSLLFILDALTTIISTALIFFYVKDKEKTDESFVQVEGRQAEVSNTTSIFSFLRRNPVLVIFSIIMLVYNFCYIQWTFMLPLQTVSIFKESGVGLFSLLVSINAIVVILLTPFLTSFTQKTSTLKAIFIGGFFYFISFALFSINRFVLTFFIAIIVMTIGEILISINTNNYIAQRTPKEYMGRTTSMLFLVNGIGYAIGPVVMGNLLALISFQNAWLIVAAIMLCGALSMYFVRCFDKTINEKQ